MLYNDRIDISDWIDPAKGNSNKEFMLCRNWFFYHGFEFQNSVCYGCHDLRMLCVNITIVTVKGIDYRCAIHEISKSEAIQLLENSIFDDCGNR